MAEAALMDRQILRAKLYVPRYRTNAVPRSRLHERLDEGASDTDCCLRAGRFRQDDFARGLEPAASFR